MSLFTGMNIAQSVNGRIGPETVGLETTTWSRNFDPTSAIAPPSSGARGGFIGAPQSGEIIHPKSSLTRAA